MSYEPQITDAARAYQERMIGGGGFPLAATDPEFVERFANFAFDEVVAATSDQLDDRARLMCWLATCLGCQGIDEFRVLVPAALNMGVEPVTVKEIVYQAVDYLGVARVFPFLKAVNEAFEARGIQMPLEPQATTEPTFESRREGGEQAQCEAFGEHMRGFHDRGNPDYPQINQWLVRNCFGDWYTRGGLTMAERELMTFCFLAAQGGCDPQLRSHVNGNVHCGNTREFLLAVASSNLPLIGYPRTLNAIAAIEASTGE